MCILFGLTLRDRAMIVKGIRNTSISLIICISIGKLKFEHFFV